MRGSLSFKSLNGVSGANGLENVMLVQSLDEIEYIRTYHFPAGPIVAADFLSDTRLVVSPLHQLEDFGPNDIQAKDLTVMDVEENSSVRCLCSSNRVGYPEHCCGIPAGIGLIASGVENCRARRERIPETPLAVRVGAASCCKLL